MALLLRAGRNLLTLIVCLAAIGQVGRVARAADAAWPQFLGPQRNGISTETNLIDRFPAAGPQVVWRVKGGVGMSGIALDGTRAITLVERAGKQTVVALNPADGSTLWQVPLAPAYRNGMGDGSRATPTIVQDAVYVFSGEGILAALDVKSGQVRWSVNTCQSLGGEEAPYGMACSPLVVGELVIATPGAATASVAAYRATDGKLVWKAGGDPAGYSSPALLNVGGRQQVVAFTGQSVLGLDPKSGEQLWHYPFVTNFDCNIATPLNVDGKVFISAGENHGSVLLELQPAGSTFTPKEVWKSLGPTSVLRTEWQTASLLNGYLFGLDNVGGAGPITNLCCVEAATGKQLWKQNRFGKSNFIAADGKLYGTTFQGELFIVRANPQAFEELSRAPLLTSTRQAPALLAGKLYVRDDQEIVCVNVAK